MLWNWILLSTPTAKDFQSSGYHGLGSFKVFPALVCFDLFRKQWCGRTIFAFDFWRARDWWSLMSEDIAEE
ncbi:unnamed protein product [Calypogeia fissa]